MNIAVGNRVRVIASPYFYQYWEGSEGRVTAIFPDETCPYMVFLADYTEVAFRAEEIEVLPAIRPTAPQTKAILRHLEKVGSISGNEANSLYKCKALPRRILDLRELGWPIQKTMKTDATGQRYARYTLANA